MQIKTSSYSLVLFVDSMVILEAKPLRDLPWSELHTSGPILLLLVPQVLKEVDSKKRDGRLGRRAREFSRTIASAAESRSAVRLAEGPPGVDIGIAVCKKPDWNDLDDLDPDLGDSWLIAQVLNVREVPPGSRVIFSQDTNVIAGAARHGIQTRRMPDHWLNEPEPSPAEKEVQRLRGRVRELETDEPELTARISVDADDPIPVFHVESLEPSARSRIVARMLAKNPMRTQRRDVLSYSVFDDFDASYERRYTKFRDTLVPDYASRIPGYLETLYNQYSVSVLIENVGSIRAENLVVEVSARGAVVDQRFSCPPIFGPIAPKPRSRLDDMRLNIPQPYRAPAPPGRHEMVFSPKPRAAQRFEVHCEDFRQGWTWTFLGIATLTPEVEQPLEIDVRVTASNMHGELRERSSVRKDIHLAKPNELVDLESNTYVRPFPLQLQFERALDERNFDWVSWIKVDEGDD